MMSDEADLLRAIVARPDEADQTWLVLADLLEERADPRHELVRLQHQPSYLPDLIGSARQARLVELLFGGVRPCVPAWTNAVGMRFVWCPPGSFSMGSPEEEAGRDDDEGPRHKIAFGRGYWMGETPVTQTEWAALAPGEPNPSRHVRPDRPLDSVPRDFAEAFCRLLTLRDGKSYRLPTEAEWEYACRAGTATPYWWGFDVPVGRAAVGIDATSPVRSHPPNPWGLYDVHGNVFEWCAGEFGPYPSGVPPTSEVCAERGGSFRSVARQCRSAYRYSSRPDDANEGDGFRVCFTPEDLP